MTYLLDGPYDHKRFAGAVDPYPEFLWEYWSPMGLGQPLTPDLLALTPNPLIIVPPKVGPLPEVFGDKLGVFIVSQRVREAIESLEPSVHTFIPVNLMSQKDNQPLGQAFILYIGTSIDAIDREKTLFLGGAGLEDFAKDNTPRRHAIAIQSGLVEGKHLWRGGRGEVRKECDPFAWHRFCSDELKSKLEEIVGADLVFHHCK